MSTEFIHFDAMTLDEASYLLHTHEKERAKVISGGVDILQTMRRKYLPELPGVLVNIKSIPDLVYIKEDDGMLKIGALTPLSNIEASELVKVKCNILAESASVVGSPQIRNMSTVAGNICQDVCCWYYRASQDYYPCLRKGGKSCFAKGGNNRLMHSIFGAPEGFDCYATCQSDMAITLSALKASIKTTQRTMPIEQCYTLTSSGNVLGTDEIITEIQVPLPPSDTKAKYMKYSIRKAIDHPLISVACVHNKEGTKVVIGGVFVAPYAVDGVKDIIKGEGISEALAVKAGEIAVKNATPLSMNAWKVETTRILVQRAISALA